MKIYGFMDKQQVFGMYTSGRTPDGPASLRGARPAQASSNQIHN